MSRSHRRRKKNHQAVKQTTPTYAQLVARYHSGLTSKKEITRRVAAGQPNKAEPAVLLAFKDLKSIALKNGWVTE